MCYRVLCFFYANYSVNCIIGFCIFFKNRRGAETDMFGVSLLV